MKGNCGECLRRWYCDINPDECDAWPDPVPMTNADHIRSMTDEELAAEIVLLHTTCEVCDKNETCGGMLGIAMCVEGVTNWLKQPCKEENNE